MERSSGEEVEILERTEKQKREDTEQQLEPLKRQKASPEELAHEHQIRLILDKFPDLDPLMASVFLKAPKERLEELLKQPEMWVVPEAQQEKVIIGAVKFDDPDAIKHQDF
jgi:hypothetical protein